MLKWIAIAGLALTVLGGVCIALTNETLAIPGLFGILVGPVVLKVALYIWIYRDLIKEGGRRRTAIIVLLAGGLIGAGIYYLILHRHEKKATQFR